MKIILHNSQPHGYHSWIESMPSHQLTPLRVDAAPLSLGGPGLQRTSLVQWAGRVESEGLCGGLSELLAASR